MRVDFTGVFIDNGFMISFIFDTYKASSVDARLFSSFAPVWKVLIADPQGHFIARTYEK